MMSVRNDPVAAIVDASPALTARSVVASTLLGVTPPSLPARMLVQSGELFGIAPGTIRVALSRMATSGELAKHDGSYRLASPALRTRQHRQDLSRAAEREPWDGTWTLRIVTDTDRDPADRTAFRRAAVALRLAELREGVWLRPANLGEGHHTALADATATVDAQSAGHRSRPEDDPALLAATLWDLEAWARQARRLHEALDVLTPALDGARTDRADALATLGPAFVVSAATLRHFQADPLLPDPLVPGDWPGTTLRQTYEIFDATFKATWTAWVTAPSP